MFLIALGAISPADAWQAIDYRAIGLLFGLMVVSSAFVVAGFYDAATARAGRVAMTPVLISITFARLVTENSGNRVQSGYPP